MLWAAFSTIAGMVSAVALVQSRPALTPAVDLAPRFQELGLAPGHQGGRDTCSLFAVAAAANYEWARAQPDAAEPWSADFLVWAARETCSKDREQAMFYEAVAGLNAFGLCPERLMPYARAAASQTRPSEEAIRAAEPFRNRWRVHWIRRWDVSSQVSPSQFNAIRQALAEGHPVACGLRWPVGDRLRALIDPPAPRDVRDGHCVLLVGYRDDTSTPGGGVLRFRNSYGPKWNGSGHGEMSYAYLRAYANDALWLELTGPPGELPIQRFEAEDLPIIERDKCQVAPQAMDAWNARLWSGGKQLFCTADRDGSVTMAFEVAHPGTCRVRVLGTAAPDYGRIRFSLDSRNVGEVFDLHAGRVCPAGSLELGHHELAAGRHTLKVSLAGTNRLWSARAFGIDAVDLLPATK